MIPGTSRAPFIRRQPKSSSPGIGRHWRPDRHRLAEIEALVNGEIYCPNDPTWEFAQALAAAARRDPECLRAFTSMAMGLNLRSEVMERPSLADKVSTLGRDWRDHPIPGPDRDQLLSIVVGT